MNMPRVSMLSKGQNLAEAIAETRSGKLIRDRSVQVILLSGIDADER